ncbi:class A beta-lactamase [Paraclostridium bifermentans]|uniref:class A beta-lactamase n=1 Tax=Paraclostridium bifermentans TaxID=1490 RepID=UPI00290D920B|nr:class A beta-lactamase [Paraclostridium bifermentans]MDU3338254.1 class A beta-lactamase [Paraclostridium bifermentans]
MKKFMNLKIKSKQFNMSILIFIALFSLIGCNKIEDNSSKKDTNKKTETQYSTDFAKLESNYGVKLGVYVFNAETNKKIAYNADERFAYCSTFKALAAGAILEKYSIEDLKQVVNFTQKDIVSHSPVSKDKITTGMTIEEICDAAVRQSDNTAANLLFDLLDGPSGFKTNLNKLGDSVTEPARKETELNDAIPGDIRDTSTPKQLAIDLKEYTSGKALTEDKKKILIDWMSNNTTGDKLIRAGAPKDWVVADKSGAGSYGTRNDIAIVTPPNKKPIFVAVLSKKNEKDADYDNKVIEETSKIIFDYIQNEKQ